MTGSSVAGVIGASAGVVSALALVFAALPALIKTLREVRKVHVIVNQQHTDMANYQGALIRALEAAGVTVPINQAQPPPTEPTQ
jgi:hypothetical protein